MAGPEWTSGPCQLPCCVILISGQGERRARAQLTVWHKLGKIGGREIISVQSIRGHATLCAGLNI